MQLNPFCKSITLVLFINLLLTEAVVPGMKFQSNNNIKIYKLYKNVNGNIYNASLNQQLVIFGSVQSHEVVAQFWDVETKLKFLQPSKILSRLHIDRHWLFRGRSVNVNSVCMFHYTDEVIRQLDNQFCCQIKSNIGHIIGSSSCRLHLTPSGVSLCYVAIQLNTEAAAGQAGQLELTSTIHRQRSNVHCGEAMMDESIYAASDPVLVSLDPLPPVMWIRTSPFQSSPILVGITVNSLRIGEKIPIPVKILSSSARIKDQIFTIFCAISKSLALNSIDQSELATIIQNYSTYNSTHTLLELKMNVSPGQDRHLFSLNVSITNSQRVHENYANVQCCVSESKSYIDPYVICENGSPAKVFIQVDNDIIIPALKESNDVFALYSKPKIQLSKPMLQIYWVQNHRDGTVMDVTNQVTLTSVDSDHLVISKYRHLSRDLSAIVDLSCQNSINPWSLRIGFHQSTVHTVISPVSVWQSDSWKIVLSTNHLMPINGWHIPRSSPGSDICTWRYRTIRMKILTRIYKMDESGNKRYINGDKSYYVDLTKSTKINQLRYSNTNVLSVSYDSMEEYFLITANEVGSTKIELLATDLQTVITTIPMVTVDSSDTIKVIDLIVKCVDGLAFKQGQQQGSLKFIKNPKYYECVSVTMTTASPGKQCHLLIWLVFSDATVEPLSSFKNSEYRLLMTEPNGINKTVKYGDVVKVTVDNNHTNNKRLMKIDPVKKRTTISLLESSQCQQSRLIFQRNVFWDANRGFIGRIKPAIDFKTKSKPSLDPYSTTYQPSISSRSSLSPYLLYVSLCAIAVLGLLLLLLLLAHRIRTYKRCSHRTATNTTTQSLVDSPDLKKSTHNHYNSSPPPTCCASFKYPHNHHNYQQHHQHHHHHLHSNTNPSATHNFVTSHKDPYPPLLPPPGPISTNTYDLSTSINNQITLEPIVCSESAVDSGIELGKLSSYSSNTNPSNEQDDAGSSSLHHPISPIYNTNSLDSAASNCNESISIPCYKTISNLRHPVVW